MNKNTKLIFALVAIVVIAGIVGFSGKSLKGDVTYSPEDVPQGGPPIFMTPDAEEGGEGSPGGWPGGLPPIGPVNVCPGGILQGNFLRYTNGIPQHAPDRCLQCKDIGQVWSKRQNGCLPPISCTDERFDLAVQITAKMDKFDQEKKAALDYAAAEKEVKVQNAEIALQIAYAKNREAGEEFASTMKTIIQERREIIQQLHSKELDAEGIRELKEKLVQLAIREADTVEKNANASRELDKQMETIDATKTTAENNYMDIISLYNKIEVDMNLNLSDAEREAFNLCGRQKEVNMPPAT